MALITTATRRIAHVLISVYQLTASALIGRHCRHLPTCSSYTDEAIERHGLWAGGWTGLARICRCHPLGTEGFDPVPRKLDAAAHWFTPWRYGRWRSCRPPDSDRESEDELNASFPSRSAEGR